MLSSHTVLIRTFNSLKASMNTCIHHRRGKMTELRLYSAEVQRLTLLLYPRSGELRTQKLKSHLVRTQSLNVLSFKPGVGQYIAIHATLTARDFFLAYFYTSGPFTCIFSKTSPNFLPLLAVANTWFLCRPAE